jgi:transcriptional regulator with XRE-family HTH domain
MHKLRAYRELSGLSQVELAALAGTTQPTIFRLERGETKLTKEWAERLAPHLGTTAEALMFGDRAVEPGIPISVLRLVLQHLAAEYPEIIVANPIDFAAIVLDLCNYVMSDGSRNLGKAESKLEVGRLKRL